MMSRSGSHPQIGARRQSTITTKANGARCDKQQTP
jgi:hypothetical protein